MFEKASRAKIRFDASVGSLTVEDLWDLPLTSNKRPNLDDIAKALFRQIKESDTESFVIKAKKADEITQLKFDIVRHVIDVRLQEIEESEKRKTASEKKQQILAIIAQKESEELRGTSLEELKKMAESL